MTAIVDRSTEAIATFGSPGARLLAGKEGREDYREHLGRIGPLPDWPGDADPIEVIDRSGLAGRGGGYFPLARKAAASRAAAGVPVIVVNASESEPGSAKDQLLLSCRPHLVLDGAQALAAAVGAGSIIVATHAGATGYRSVHEAVAERTGDLVPVTFVCVPNRYVAGESSSIVSYINGGAALPSRRSQPTAVSGVGGRPTVVSNAETVSHLALIARYGHEWFRSAGSSRSPGSVLLTIAGDVHRQAVVEVLGPATLGDAVWAAGGPRGVPSAVLLGGYAGTWLPASLALSAPVDPAELRRLNAPLGCGFVGLLDEGRCGLTETAHLMKWLARERAGQCGACTLGLPELDERLEGLATGERRGRGEVRRLVALGESVSGRGLCHLPDGAIAMVESALVAFAEETRLHRRRRCRGWPGGYAFPTPDSAP